MTTENPTQQVSLEVEQETKLRELTTKNKFPCNRPETKLGWSLVIILIILLIGGLIVGILAIINTTDSDNNNKNGNGGLTISREAWGNNPLPKFITAQYIPLSQIYKISRFRSSAGHDYTTPSNETCRSKKHYFVPLAWEFSFRDVLPVYSPLNGTIKVVVQEWAGYQLHIESNEYPGWRVILFHVNTTHNFTHGENVTSGDLLGIHVGLATWSDIAVYYTYGGENNNFGELYSYFDVMNDYIFNQYINYTNNINNRSDLIISKEYRDSHPLCTEPKKDEFDEGFDTYDSDNITWVYINPNFTVT